MKRYFKLPDKKSSKLIFNDFLLSKSIFLPRVIDKPLVLYGAGNLGKMACDYLKKINLNPIMIIDKNYDQNKLCGDLEVFSLQDVPHHIKLNSILAVCVVTENFSSIKDELKDYGWEDIVPFYDLVEFYRDIHPLSNGWFAEPFLKKDIDKIFSVIDLLSDDISRAHYLNFLAWRRLREDWFFEDAEIKINDRFFVKGIIELSDFEEFIDLGAHFGFVTIDFLRRVKNKFSKVILFEADNQNFIKLSENLEIFKKKFNNKIELNNTFIGLNKKINFFSGLGYASQKTKKSDEKINSKTLDSFNFSPTFIKFHLEGYELDALKGSIETIINYRPKLVLTIYHNSLGIYEIPLWLKKNLVNYNFYLRSHGWCGTGTVLYCIPAKFS